MLLIFICILSQVLLFFNAVFFFFTGVETAKLTEIILLKILGTQLYTDPKAPALDSKARIILCNHRSFADFFIDSLVIGHCTHLSRFAVIFVLPLSAFYGALTGRVLYFRRDKRDRQALAFKIKSHFQFRDCPMVIYPEGHRNATDTSLPLKIGALKIAYEHQHVIQCVLTSSKDKVLNEKKLHASMNVDCITTRSQPVNPADYSSFEEFLQVVKEQWNSTWMQLQSLEKESCLPYHYPVTHFRLQWSKPWIDRPLALAVLLLTLMYR